MGLAEVKRVSEALHLAVKIEGRRPLPFESEPLEKLDLLLGDVSAERTIAEELFEPRFHAAGWLQILFHETESLWRRGAQSAIQVYRNAKRCEVHVPGLDERIEERCTIFVGYVEDIDIEKFEDIDPHLFITAVAGSCENAKPPLVVQFFPGERLHHVEKLLRDQAFDLTERLPLENGADLL
ncbi:MAG TPA: hypothetical protein VLK65_20860 [Vicinamibacteria bacterium]|nr:hypothetical protein [Vicinamibacteria bacterium]